MVGFLSHHYYVIYMNQLQWLKSKLIEEERYEEAAKINKCIEDEYNKLNNRKL